MSCGTPLILQHLVNKTHARTFIITYLHALQIYSDKSATSGEQHDSWIHAPHLVHCTQFSESLLSSLKHIAHSLISTSFNCFLASSNVGLAQHVDDVLFLLVEWKH